MYAKNQFLLTFVVITIDNYNTYLITIICKYLFE